MELPTEVPVMTLQGATLFPQALLPLYIFEPRYRRMLRDALDSHRLLSVAMQKPGSKRETPCRVAGLGVIRVSVGHRDGTSHLILQGLTRVRLDEAVQYKPYRVHRLRPLAAPSVEPGFETVQHDALAAKVVELVAACLTNGTFKAPLPQASGLQGKKPGPPPVQDIVRYLRQVDNPDQLADLVSGAVLTDPDERQSLLETVEVPKRLRKLIQFLQHKLSSAEDDE